MITSFSGEYRFLSNFFPVKIMFCSLEYPTVEHAYQAAKTLDWSMRSKLADEYVTAGEAKRIGQSVTLREDWVSIKLDVMFMLLSQKFNQHPFSELLAATKDKELVEGNHWGDKFWGIHSDGEGQNNLGKLLMKIRGLQ